MSVHIETPRLLIREMLEADAPAMLEMDSDPLVHKYLGEKPTTDLERIKEVIAFVRQQYVEQGIGRWSVTLKSDGSFIGWTGWKLMKEAVNGHVNHYDFGYRHLRKYWRQGYAYEAAKAVLDYGLNELGFDNAYAMTDVDNIASRALLEKLGFRLVEIFPYDGAPLWLKGKPTTWYQLPIER